MQPSPRLYRVALSARSRWAAVNIVMLVASLWVCWTFLSAVAFFCTPIAELGIWVILVFGIKHLFDEVLNACSIWYLRRSLLGVRIEVVAVLIEPAVAAFMTASAT